jgi:hypothetical protein
VFVPAERRARAAIAEFAPHAQGAEHAAKHAGAYDLGVRAHDSRP